MTIAESQDGYIQEEICRESRDDLFRLAAMRPSQIIEKVPELDASFENVTEEEIIFLWRSFKSSGLSGDAAWHAIVTGIALDMAFSRSRKLPQTSH